ncbi:unnamed protein product [Protopolystoma xenopodis]|uniref:ACAD9/ACADV-like C-terminal domain-containing protein n=1 Tax=Protopolystoma xenopodis TaxID=117903 RepID=A0A3S5CTR6_9PLAT|nr:unnamed protein product [Protopolystoma xenopodis]
MSILRVPIRATSSNGILRLLIAGQALSYSWNMTARSINKLRYPLRNYLFNYSFYFEQLKLSLWPQKFYPVGLPSVSTDSKSSIVSRSASGDKRVSLGAGVHPFLEFTADALSVRIRRFQKLTEILLSRYARAIAYEQVILTRMADISIDCYAAIACLSRANRSADLQLSNWEHEVIFI